MCDMKSGAPYIWQVLGLQMCDTPNVWQTQMWRKCVTHYSLFVTKSNFKRKVEKLHKQFIQFSMFLEIFNTQKNQFNLLNAIDFVRSDETISEHAFCLF